MFFGLRERKMKRVLGNRIRMRVVIPAEAKTAKFRRKMQHLLPILHHSDSGKLI